MGTDDFQLLCAWRAGDKDAGDRLVSRHFDRLYRFFTGEREDVVADLVQRTWVACIQKRHHIPENVAFRAFLLGIARKELLMHLRKHHRGRRALSRIAATDPPSVTTPSGAVAAHEQRRLLSRALRQMPSEARIVLELYYWEDLTLKDIAAILGLRPVAVKSRLHRARERLRASMASANVPLANSDTTLRCLEEIRTSRR